ncbi:RNA degradosome polyphosphate kinase [Paramylibacter kogurei]|uniref:RNA degradosome polyphosphate kinase n=1 Tax=Paramylibacter kogurei TaxID=1889778 RepID=UPI000C162371|nr:RNA degradosome polyphosphate kinase [Amylibacter kogurei]
MNIPLTTPEVDADFLNSHPSAPVEHSDVSMESDARFVNREMSWLAFNWRVLGEAANDEIPLLERVRMLSISNTNLDEFYTVRVAGLRELYRGGIDAPSYDGLTPKQQLDLIDADASRLMERQQEIWSDLIDELAVANIVILEREDLSKDDLSFLRDVFKSKIFPVLSPMAVDPAHPFPFIPSEGLALALNLSRKKDGRPLTALLPIPNQVDRFIELPRSDDNGHRMVLLETVILSFLGDLFPGYELLGDCIFRVLRDSDLEIEDEAEDLVREFETALKRRRRGHAVRLKLSADAPSDLRRLILRELDVDENEVFELSGLLGMSDVSELIVSDRPDLQWPQFKPRVPERVQDYMGNIFAAIQQKDMLLHHPYESFDIVVQFLQQAARDPNVVAIKQTLYRTSNQSPIVEALCEAAENGKSVTALVELKARFDEAANIRQSRRLERAGAHVVYGFIDLKTHAKISTVVRREGDSLATYTHFGTGNYHPITANIYTDLSFFTCSKTLGRDAAKVFNYLSGYARPERLKKLSISPDDLKSDLLEKIEQESAHARAGKKGAIWAKMNALVDPEIIDALYRASNDGVQIDLVVRGICCLRANVKGLSENIRVKSIVGRFLEHSRIVCFANGNGLPHKKASVYMSSADWMGRNLHRRVETLVSITNKTVHAQIMSQIMAANMADVQNSWVMQSDGSYLRHNAPIKEGKFNCHRFFMENPSLSGRGKAGVVDVPKLTHSYDDQDE